MLTKPDKLPDVLAKNLRLVFVGTAASARSASVGHYYAHPGNRFWRAIHEAGLTPRRYAPHEFRALLPLSIGFTDLNKSESGMDHQLSHDAIDVDAFSAKMKMFQPKAIAFTSKRAASHYLGQPTQAIAFGRQQPASNDGPAIFVLTSPSGAASGHWSLQPWRDLAHWFHAKETHP